jgi:hypothetical protein
MTYKLTDEQRKKIERLASAYWWDLKFEIKGQRVIAYVEDYLQSSGRCYNEVFAESENAAAIICAIWNSPEYYNRSKVSARSIVANCIQEAYEDAPDFAKPNLAQYLR